MLSIKLVQCSDVAITETSEILYQKKICIRGLFLKFFFSYEKLNVHIGCVNVIDVEKQSNRRRRKSRKVFHCNGFSIELRILDRVGTVFVKERQRFQ
jgi:hypothetical protein